MNCHLLVGTGKPKGFLTSQCIPLQLQVSKKVLFFRKSYQMTFILERNNPGLGQGHFPFFNYLFLILIYLFLAVLNFTAAWAFL